MGGMDNAGCIYLTPAPPSYRAMWGPTCGGAVCAVAAEHMAGGGRGLLTALWWQGVVLSLAAAK